MYNFSIFLRLVHNACMCESTHMCTFFGGFYQYQYTIITYIT